MPDGQLGSGFGVVVFLVFLAAAVPYFVTFELDDGERREFRLAGAHFGELVAGDRGLLTYQGSRLVSFTRDRTIEAR